MNETRRLTLRAKVILGAVMLAALLVALLFRAHYSAKARVEAYKRELRAKGEKLTVAELAPLPPTNGANGAAALMSAASRLSSPDSEHHPRLMKFVAPGRARVTWMKPELAVDKTTNTWPALQEWLENYRDVLDEARAALENPVLFFNVRYQDGFDLRLPHLIRMRSLAVALQIAAVLELHEGDPDRALEDLLSLTALVQRYHWEPTMMSQIFRTVFGSIAMATTWEALQYPRWEEQQLEKLQMLWQAMNLLDDLAPSLAMERAFGGSIYEQVRKSPDALQQIITGNPSASALSDLAEKFVKYPKIAMKNLLERYPGHWIWKWWWSYDDELWYWQQMQALIAATHTMARGGAYATIRPSLTNLTVSLEDSGPRFVVGRMILPGFRHHPEKIAKAEIQRRMVIAAIALKRFQLRHGKNPDKLSALIPEFLSAVPIDFMDGQPLRYRLNADDSFTLYSIGNDGKDDDGDPRPPENSKSRDWLQGRDWVWPQPATPEEIKAAEEKEIKAR